MTRWEVVYLCTLGLFVCCIPALLAYAIYDLVAA